MKDNGPHVPPSGTRFVVRGQTIGGSGGAAPAVMAIVNRTTDSFWSGARQWDIDVALRAVEDAVTHGADIVDIGGVRAGVGPPISVDEEIGRVVPFIHQVCQLFPDTAFSVDTYRAPVAQAAAQAGVHIINDTWAGHDPNLVTVAATYHLGLVCSHTGGLLPELTPIESLTHVGSTRPPPQGQTTAIHVMASSTMSWQPSSPQRTVQNKQECRPNLF